MKKKQLLISVFLTTLLSVAIGVTNSSAAQAACSIPAPRDAFQSRLQSDAKMFMGANSLKIAFCDSVTVTDSKKRLGFADGKIKQLAKTEAAAKSWYKLHGGWKGEWCAWNAWFLLRGLPNYPGDVNVKVAREKMLKRGAVYVTKGKEQPGDVIVYGTDDHMGVVITSGQGKIVVLEGNTSGGTGKPEFGPFKLRPNPYKADYKAIRPKR